MDEHDSYLEHIPIADEHGIVHRVDVRIICKGMVCPYVTLRSPLAANYVGYQTLMRDLDDCSKILNYLAETTTADQVVQNALWESFITKYGRCFTDTAGRKTKLDNNDITKSAPNEIVWASAHLIKERHQFTAHAGLSDSDIMEGRLALLSPQLGKSLVRIYVSGSRVTKPSEELTLLFQQLIAHVKKQVDLKLGKVLSKLMKEMSEKDIEDLYNQSISIIS